MDFDKLPEVAKNVYYPCNKCDRDRYFKVLAHLSETEARLECEVCGAKRKLNIAKKAKAKTKRKTRSSKNKHLELYTDLQEKNKDKIPAAYAISGQFPADSVIQHPTFGMGYVTESVAHKIEVVFEEGVKTLMHQRD